MLLLCVAAFLFVIQIGLRCLPRSIVSRILKKLNDNCLASRALSDPSPQRIVRTIELSSRYLRGGASCLVQAIAAQFLLKIKGCQSQMWIGVARQSDGQIGAHAWLESHGKIILGNRSDLHEYRVLQPCR